MLLIDPLRIALSLRAARDVDALQRQLQHLGVAGALVLVAIILVHAVVLFPAEIPNAVAGLVYGFAVALPLVLAAWVASGLIAYGSACAIGRPLAVRIAGEERVATAERVIGKGGAPALLMSRLIPFVPFSLVGYIAGADARAHLALHVDLARSACCRSPPPPPTSATPWTTSRSADPLVWVAVGTLVVLVVLTATFARRMRGASSS